MRIRTLTLKVDREDLLALSTVMHDAVANLLPLMKEE